MPELDPILWVAVLAVAIFAGVVKGAVGFAMPMILISGLGTFLAPEVALAALILPTAASNVWQSARGGLGNAFDAAKAHRLYIAIVLVMILLSAQVVLLLPDRVAFLVIGVPITAFAATQLLGWRPRIGPAMRRPAEIGIGLLAGTMGGISGTWGPPTVLYLTALETPKREFVQVQGVVYGLGALVLLVGHLNSGVFTAERAQLSAIICVPAGLGMLAGFWLQDQLDQERFRAITLAVLVVAGANLIRRGIFV